MSDPAAIDLIVAKRRYRVGCGPGEEGRVRALGAHVDRCAEDVLKRIGAASEEKVLLLAALTVVDQLFQARDDLTKLQDEMDRVAEQVQSRATSILRTLDHRMHAMLDGVERTIAEDDARLSG